MLRHLGDDLPHFAWILTLKRCELLELVTQFGLQAPAVFESPILSLHRFRSVYKRPLRLAHTLNRTLILVLT